MAEVTTAPESPASTAEPDGDAEPADRFPFMRFCPEIRVMIWHAAMPDFATCNLILHCEGTWGDTTLTLIPERRTKVQRTPIATLSTVCHESRHEVILKYPDLLPLRDGHLLRFSSSEDVVMLTRIEDTFDGDCPVWDFELDEHGNLDLVIHFPFEWNTQVQNIAFDPAYRLMSAGTAALDPQAINYWVKAMKPKLDFLNHFPRVRNYFVKHTVVYASETLAAVRKEWQEASIQTYVEQEFASLEHIPWPEYPDFRNIHDTCNIYDFWYEDEYNPTVSYSARFLDDHKDWLGGVDPVLNHMMHRNTQDDRENRAFATRLRGINYSTLVGFWKCDATHSEVGPFVRQRFSEAQQAEHERLREGRSDEV